MEQLPPQVQAAFPFHIKIKTMYKAYHLKHLFEQVIPSLTHENDGLVFTPRLDPYVPGTCTRLLKWKPARLNTVDFRVSVGLRHADTGAAVIKLLVMAHGKHKFYGFLGSLKDGAATPELPEGAVVECRYDPEAHTQTFDEAGHALELQPGGWVFLRIRKDKANANAEHVVTKIIESINDNVTQDELVRSTDAIHRAWRARQKETR